MMDESIRDRSIPWRKFFIVAAGFGAGVTLVVIAVGALVLWYATRAARIRPWNQSAIKAKYADLYLEYVNAGQPRL